jgi:hypothetical protein
MRGLSRKQVFALGELWVRVPQLPLLVALLGNEATIGSRQFVKRVQNKEIPWSSGNDSWPTTRQRWFESIRDYCVI